MPISPTLVVVTYLVKCAMGSISAFPALQPPVTCKRDCVIELRPIVSFAIADTTISSGWSIHVVRDSAGRYFFVSDDLRSLLAFDKDGRMIQAKLGRNKSFGRITNLLAAPDGTLRLYEVESSSLLALGHDLDVAGSTRLPYRPSLLMKEGYLVAHQITTPELVGQPLHIMDASGRIVRSFGSDSSSYKAGEPYFNDRVVAPSRNGSVWSIAPGRRIVERWDAAGQRLARIEIPGAWFHSSPGPSPQTERPTPTVTALWEEGDVLWVLSRDADSKWATPTASGERESSTEEHQRMYDWVLEAIDVSSGTLISMKRFDFPLSRRGHSVGIASWRATGMGAPTSILLSQAVLVSKEAKK